MQTVSHTGPKDFKIEGRWLWKYKFNISLPVHTKFVKIQDMQGSNVTLKIIAFCFTGTRSSISILCPCQELMVDAFLQLVFSVTSIKAHSPHFLKTYKTERERESTSTHIPEYNSCHGILIVQEAYLCQKFRVCFFPRSYIYVSLYKSLGLSIASFEASLTF